MAEIFKEILGEDALSPKIIDIALGKAQIAEVIDSLLKTCHYRKSAVVGNIAEEKVKVRYSFAHTVFKVAVSHCKLIKIGEHR